MTIIELTQGQIAMVDDDLAAGIGRHKWYAAKMRGANFYAVREVGGRRVYMHRMICGAGDGVVVDHINGDTLDNRRANLRPVSAAENNHNRHHQVYARTGVRFVSNQRGKFVARVVRDGNQNYLGSFDTLRDASEAVDRFLISAARTPADFNRIIASMQEKMARLESENAELRARTAA